MKYMCRLIINMIQTNGYSICHDKVNMAPKGIEKERRGRFLIISEYRNMSHYPKSLINFYSTYCITQYKYRVEKKLLNIFIVPFYVHIIHINYNPII